LLTDLWEGTLTPRDVHSRLISCVRC